MKVRPQNASSPQNDSSTAATVENPAATLSRVSVRSRLQGLLTGRPGSMSAVAILAGVALVGSISGAAVYKASEKTVQLSVDGQVRSVSSHAGTVGEVLAAAGLTAGAHDLLAPNAGEQITDGQAITLRRGRDLQLTVDGVKRAVWVTAPSVAEALAQLGIGDSRAFLSASRSRQIGLEGLTLDVRTAKTVDLIADGKPRALLTTAPTVRDLLVQGGVTLRPADKISVPLDRRPVEGMQVRVTRVDAQRQLENVAIAYDTQHRPDSTIYQGQTQVLQTGVPGVVVKTWSVTMADGQPDHQTLISQVMTAKPVTQIIGDGTAVRPVRSTGSSADGLNWGALANCESGGNPRSVSSSGAYRGLYQFSFSTWRSVGGDGDPIDAAPSEQTYRAELLYNRSGRGSWPTCGRYL